MSNLGLPILGPRTRAFFRTGPPCCIYSCLPPPDQLSQWAHGGLSVGSLGHALTFQSLANLALANNNYTNWRGARKPPPNHTVTVCRLGIVFQPSWQSTQPGIQSHRNAQAARFRSSPGSLRRPGAVIQKERRCWFGLPEGHCLWPCHGPQTLPLQDTLG
jgi:hypothetical protein